MTAAEDLVTYISIGNSNNKLSQQEWCTFIGQVRNGVSTCGDVLGEWFSLGDAPWQNACWAVRVRDKTVLQAGLRHAAQLFRQDSISWVEGRAELLGPPGV